MALVTRIAAGLALAFFLLPATAMAQSAEEMQAMFGQMDANGDGELTTDEIGFLMGGATGDSPEAQMMIVVLDEDGSGGISAAEFAAVATMMSGQLTDAQLQRLFTHFDLNSDAVVDRSELTSAMQSMGGYEGEESVDEALAEADSDGNGQIDFSEFKSVVN